MSMRGFSHALIALGFLLAGAQAPAPRTFTDAQGYTLHTAPATPSAIYSILSGTKLPSALIPFGTTAGTVPDAATVPTTGAQINALLSASGTVLPSAVTGVPPITVNGTGVYVTNPSTGVIYSLMIGSSQLPSGTTLYSLEANTVPLANRIVSLDAALPATQSQLVTGAAGIQTDSNGNVITLMDASGVVQTSATSFGRTQLSQGGLNGFPFFHSTPTGYNTTYDALTLTPSLGISMFAPASAAWQVAFVVRQTGATASGLMNVVYSSGTQVNIAGGGTDGRLLVGQNDGSAVGTEGASAFTALNQWEIVIVTCDGTRYSVIRNGQQTYQTGVDAAHAGGGRIAPTKFEFLNNAQADVAVVDVAAGLLSAAHMDAYDKALATRYGLTVATITTGSSADIAPGVPDLTATWLTTENFPLSDQLPIAKAGFAPPGGLTLSSGATQNFDVVFGSNQASANVTTPQQLRNLFYFTYLEGDQTYPNAGPEDGHVSAYNTVIRHYAPGDPNDVTPVNPDGVYLKAIPSQNYTNVGNGQIWGGLLRFPTVFKPGMSIYVRYKSPNDKFSWVPIWLYSGQQKTPGPGGNPYTGFNTNGALIPNLTANKLIEIDWNDNFSRFASGTPTGQQVDFGIPDIYGTPYVVRPYIDYGANGSGYIYPAGSGPVYVQQPLDTSAAFVDMVMNWRNDGSNLIDVFYNGALVATGYVEYNANTAGTYVDASGATQTMGLYMMIGNQAVPTFVSGYGTQTPADLANCTMIVQEVAAWNGTIVNPDSFRATVQAPNLTIRGTTPNYQSTTSTASGIFTSGTPVTLTATLDGSALTLSNVTITTLSGTATYARGTWSATYTDSGTLGAHMLIVSGNGTYASTSAPYTERVAPVPVALGVTSLSTLIPGATATVSGTFNFGAPASLTATQDGTAITPGSPVITVTSGSAATAAGTFTFTQINPAAAAHVLAVSSTGSYAATAANFNYTTSNDTLSEGGFAFSWYNQSTATFSGGGPNPIILTSPANNAVNIPQGIVTPITATGRTYTAMIVGSYPSGQSYSLGLMMSGASANADYLNNVFANSTGSGEQVIQGPISNMYGTTLVAYGTQPIGALGMYYCARATYDGTTNWQFALSSTCMANSWTVLGTVSNATLGNPTSIGVFLNAAGSSASSGAETVTFSKWTETTSTNVQQAQ